MEITVVLAIVSILMIVIYSLLEETMQMTMFNESHNELAILSQSAVNALQSEVVQTKVAFEENANGIAYRSALTMPAGVTPWPDSFLPVFDAAGDLEPDPTTQRFTGNSMLVARQLEPLTITYDDDGTALTPEVEFLADRYRFEYVYLARSSRSFSGSGMTLDLLMSTSGEYADFFQLASMTPAATSRIAQKLSTAGLSRAWNPGQPIHSAFYTLAGAFDGTFNAPVNAPAIPIATTKSLLRGLLGGRISGRMDYSVAFAPASPASPFPILTPVRLFARAEPSKPGFPSGFEVKIAGPARNRQVMTRVVLMSHYGTRRYESQQAFVVTAARF
jgi:Tfp pilus assembly protein FimT